jgi:hypothetical protein
MERATGIELHPKFLSVIGTRCYPLLCESIVAKMLPRTIHRLTKNCCSTHLSDYRVKNVAAGAADASRAMLPTYGA